MRSRVNERDWDRANVDELRRVEDEENIRLLYQLKLWTRSSMTEDRLSGLAMLLIHRGTDFIPTPTEIYDMKSNWRGI